MGDYIISENQKEGKEEVEKEQKTNTIDINKTYTYR